MFPLINAALLMSTLHCLYPFYLSSTFYLLLLFLWTASSLSFARKSVSRNIWAAKSLAVYLSFFSYHQYFPPNASLSSLLRPCSSSFMLLWNLGLQLTCQFSYSIPRYPPSFLVLCNLHMAVTSWFSSLLMFRFVAVSSVMDQQIQCWLAADSCNNTWKEYRTRM